MDTPNRTRQLNWRPKLVYVQSFEQFISVGDNMFARDSLCFCLCSSVNGGASWDKGSIA